MKRSFCSDSANKMNIKSVTPNIMPLEGLGKADSGEKVRFKKATDRDANGRQEGGQEKQKEHQFSDGDWAEALKKLKSLPAVVKNQLTVEAFVEGEKRFVRFLTLEGECIRRLTETDVWQSLKNIDIEQPKGQLLNKAM